MNKNGISAIVATVLIVLISVAGVAIVWVGVLPMFDDALGDVNTDVRLNIISSEGYTIWDSDAKLVAVQVERKGEGEACGLDLIFIMGGDSVSHYVDGVPDENARRVYYINLSDYPGGLSKISVAPVFCDGSVGNVISSLEFGDIPEADIAELIEDGVLDVLDFESPNGGSEKNFVPDTGDCVPSCEDKVCGSDGCDGDCGDCDEGYDCVSGGCVEDVVPFVCEEGDNCFYVSVFGTGEHNGSLGDEFNLSEAQSYADDNLNSEIMFLLGGGNYGEFSMEDERSAWVTWKADEVGVIFEYIELGGLSGPYNKYIHFEGIKVTPGQLHPMHGYYRAVSIRDARYIKFIDMEFEGSGYSDGDNGVGIYMWGGNNIIIDRCRIYGNGSDHSAFEKGIYSRNSRNVVINGCDISDSGFGISAWGMNWTLTNNHLYDLDSDGIVVEGVENGLIANNLIHDVIPPADSGAHADGIQFYYTESGGAHNSSSVDHVYMRDIIVDNNTIYNIGRQGIFINPGAYIGPEDNDALNLVFKNNLIYNTDIEDIGSYSFVSKNNANQTFINNTIMGSSHWRAGSEVNIVKGNLLELGKFWDGVPKPLYNDYNLVWDWWGNITKGTNSIETRWDLNDPDKLILFGIFADTDNGDFHPVDDSVVCDGSYPWTLEGIAWAGALECELACSDGDKRNCEKQVDICSGSTETCIGGTWLGCGYNDYFDWDSSYDDDEIGLCGDGYDNDCDGCIDGIDSDCGGVEIDCDDDVDNDCDGFLDCSDSDCFAEAACQAPEDYLSYWKFDERIGDETPDETGVNNGTLDNDADIVSSSRGNVLSLDGDMDWVDTTQIIFNSNEVTYCSWINTRKSSGLTMISDCIGGSAGIGETGFSFELNMPDGIRLRMANESDVYGGIHTWDTSLDINQWYHICASFNTTDIRYFMDGVEESSSSSINMSNFGTCTSTMRIGDRTQALYRNLNGFLDNLMIFNRSLDADEIGRIYCSQGGVGDC